MKMGIGVSGEPEVSGESAARRLEKTHGLSADQFLGHTDAQLGTVDANKNFTPNASGTVMQFRAGSIIDPTSITTYTMPLPEFNAIKSSLQPTAKPVVPAPATGAIATRSNSSPAIPIPSLAISPTP
jgi:hypothetical protein